MKALHGCLSYALPTRAVQSQVSCLPASRAGFTQLQSMRAFRLPDSSFPFPCSDHEAEWQQLERMEQLDAEWHRELEAERAARELLLLQPALGQRGTAQQQRAGQQGDEAAQTAAPQPLPSPINSGTVDLDAAMARLLASAGNTPTGPLGLGLRSAPADVPGAAATEQGG